MIDVERTQVRLKAVELALRAQEQGVVRRGCTVMDLAREIINLAEVSLP